MPGQSVSGFAQGCKMYIAALQHAPRAASREGIFPA